MCIGRLLCYPRMPPLSRIPEPRLHKGSPPGHLPHYHSWAHLASRREVSPPKSVKFCLICLGCRLCTQCARRTFGRLHSNAASVLSILNIPGHPSSRRLVLKGQLLCTKLQACISVSAVCPSRNNRLLEVRNPERNPPPPVIQIAGRNARPTDRH